MFAKYSLFILTVASSNHVHQVSQAHIFQQVTNVNVRIYQMDYWEEYQIILLLTGVNWCATLWWNPNMANDD